MKKKDGNGLFKSVFMAYLILMFHILLIAGLGLLVLFFRGVSNYLLWIFLGGGVLIFMSAFMFYRRMKEQGRTLREMVNSPLFGGRSVEVNFMGGLASFKIGRPSDVPMIAGPEEPIRQLEDPATVRVRELAELARLLENNLITQEEFNTTKRQLFNS